MKALFVRLQNRRLAARLGMRDGFALPMALIIIIIGLVLSGLIFDIGHSFFSTVLNQESLYADHVAVSDYTEAAKGWLVKYNMDTGQVKHALLRPSPDMPVGSLNDLMLDDPAGTPSDQRHLSFDREVPHRRGSSKRVTVNVFDVHYFKENLTQGLLEDTAQMRVLPPPINTVASPTSSGSGLVAIGDSVDSTKKHADDAGGGPYPWDKYGAYVVRVQLYDVDKNGNRALKRVVDEAFYQVLNND